MNLRRLGTVLLGVYVAAGSVDGRGGRAWSDSRSQGKVLLMEAGAEPREHLRYRCVKGRKEKGSGSAVTKDLRDAKRPEEKAAVSVTLTVDDVTPAFETDYAFTLDKLELVSLLTRFSEPGDTPKEQQGTVVKVKVDERGARTSTSFVKPKGVDSSMYAGEAMDELDYLRPPPFPAEPVGLGARWEIVTQLPSGGWQGQESTVCTLKARRGNRVEIAVEIAQTAKPQTIRDEDVTSELLKFAGSGTGTFHLDLEGVLPLRGLTTVVTEETRRNTHGQFTSERTKKMQRTTVLSGAVVPPPKPK